VVAIWIDVHPKGETWYTLNIHTHDKLYAATFHANPIELDGSYCSWEKELLSQSTACWLTDPRVPTQFLSPNRHWSSRLKTIIYWRTCYIGLFDPYLQHVISTFNTCSRGQLIGPEPRQMEANTLEVSAFHITLFTLPNQQSSTFP
jgi:hypothetical protein